MRQIAIKHVQISTADTTGMDFEQYLTSSWLRHWDKQGQQWLSRSHHHHGTHFLHHAVNYPLEIETMQRR